MSMCCNPRPKRALPVMPSADEVRVPLPRAAFPDAILSDNVARVLASRLKLRSGCVFQLSGVFAANL